MNKFQITNILCCLALLFVFARISFSQTEENLLKKAYVHNSKIILDEFFYKWQLQTPPISFELFQSFSDTVKEVYNVYYAFIQSFVDHSIKQYKLENYDKLFNNIKYLILQDNLNYEIEETENPYIDNFQAWILQLTSVKTTKASISNFRPVIVFNDLKGVFLTTEYYELFNNFYDNEFKNKNPKFVNNDSLYIDYYNKTKFLNDYIRIIHKGNIGTPVLQYNELLSDPIIQKIVFDKKLLKAKLYFSISCGNYVAYLEYINNEWKLISCFQTSIC